MSINQTCDDEVQIHHFGIARGDECRERVEAMGQLMMSLPMLPTACLRGLADRIGRALDCDLEEMLP